ncbi:hypothetical protein AB205_0191680 [Aquarana catesbeiana]|uniref:SP-RING-type domain-containing protein n=1 Tax=Aquarana catesbeiana TaxID=8400 RepID=A0A2G9R7J8_AQUCT|nr:hypothetical protein AB205_0191680 [Aquarana catesbeiana]
MRLTLPCRAVTCTHLQCFDAALYLQMNEKKPTWICPVCDKKASYESLILDGLFMEILNQCSDVDEIQFQEDGSWCPMRPKKEPLTSPSTQYPHIEGSGLLSKMYTIIEPTETKSKNKAEVIDLTVESSSEDEEEPAKKKCLYMPETPMPQTKGRLLAAYGAFFVTPQFSASFPTPDYIQHAELYFQSPYTLHLMLNKKYTRVLTYHPSTIRMGKVGGLETDSLHSSMVEYSDPFRHPAISGLPADLSDLDFLPLAPVPSQQYYHPMFLDSLKSALQARSTHGKAKTSNSPLEEPSSEESGERNIIQGPKEL